MQLPRELANKHQKYSSLEGLEDLRFELFDWLKKKGLTVRQATNLLDMTKGEICEARRAMMDEMIL